jgi:cholesterol transport system auxiliary component
MNTSGYRLIPHRALRVLMPALLLAGCTALSAPRLECPNTYVLEARPDIRASQVKRDLILSVSMPRARPGFETPQMAYVQQPHELNYFVTSRWADSPARMLAPLLVQAVGQTGSFRAVVQSTGTGSADVRLDTELIRLQHDFGTRPSRVQFTLRAQLIDVRGKRVLAEKLFDETENAASDDAYGGVVAANRVLQRVLGQVSDFCVTESGPVRPVRPE